MTSFSISASATELLRRHKPEKAKGFRVSTTVLPGFFYDVKRHGDTVVDLDGIVLLFQRGTSEYFSGRTLDYNKERGYFFR